MTHEHLQSIETKRLKKKTLVNGLRAAGTAAFLTAGTILPNVGHVSADNGNFLPESQVTQSLESKSEKISDLLDSNEARAVLISGLAFSLAALAGAYVTSRDMDDNYIEKILRFSPPVLFAASAGTLIIDSYETIPSDIPVDLMVGASFLAAAHTILNTFERRKDLENRASAIAIAGGFIALGTSILVAHLNS